MAETGAGQWVGWRVEDPPCTVEFPRSVMETVRSAAMEGLHRLARGGLEVGGLLLGVRDGSAVRILDTRPVACEHAFGPSFTLSPRDEAALGMQIASLTPEPGAAGPTVVGWYHTHTRSDICLSDTDLEIFDRYFPEPWQVALVVRPDKLRPARAGFFFREPDGTLRRESSYGVFELQPVSMAPKPEGEVQPAPAVDPPNPEVELPVPGFAQAALRPDRPRPRFWLLFALAWCISVASLVFALRDYWLPAPAAPAEPVPGAPDPAVVELTRERDQLAAEVQKLRADVDRLTVEAASSHAVKPAPKKTVPKKTVPKKAAPKQPAR